MNTRRSIGWGLAALGVTNVVLTYPLEWAIRSHHLPGMDIDDIVSRSLPWMGWLTLVDLVSVFVGMLVVNRLAAVPKIQSAFWLAGITIAGLLWIQRGWPLHILIIQAGLIFLTALFGYKVSDRKHAQLRS